MAAAPLPNMNVFAPPAGGGTANSQAPIGSVPGDQSTDEGLAAQVPTPASMSAQNPHSPLVENIIETVKGMGQTAASMVGNNLTSTGDLLGRVAAVPGQVSTLIQGGINAPPGAIPEKPAQAIPGSPVTHKSIGDHVDEVLSAHASRTGGKGGGGPAGMQYDKVDFKGQANAAEESRKAIDEETKARLDVLKSESIVRDERMKYELAHAEKLQHIANEADAALDARVKAKEATKQAILDQATTIDPDRWMKSRTPLQMAAMVIANGLTHGRAWQQFQTSIDNDVKAQQQSFENRRTQLKDADAVDDSIYGMYRQRGLDRRDAAIATHDTMQAIFKQRFEAVALASNSDFVKANAHAAIAATQSIEAKNQAAEVNAQNEFKLKQQKLALDTWEAKQRVDLEREKMAAKAAAGSGVGSPGDTQEMKGPQTEAIALQEYLAENTKALYKLFPENSIGIDAPWNKAKAAIPGTEGYAFNQKREAVLQNLRVAMEKGIVRKEDIPYYDGIFKKAYDVGGKNAWKEAVASAESALQKSLDAAADAGMGGTVAKMKARMSKPGGALAPVIDFQKK